MKLMQENHKEYLEKMIREYNVKKTKLQKEIEGLDLLIGNLKKTIEIDDSVNIDTLEIPVLDNEFSGLSIREAIIS